MSLRGVCRAGDEAIAMQQIIETIASPSREGLLLPRRPRAERDAPQALAAHARPESDYRLPAAGTRDPEGALRRMPLPVRQGHVPPGDGESPNRRGGAQSAPRSEDRSPHEPRLAGSAVPGVLLALPQDRARKRLTPVERPHSRS